MNKNDLKDVFSASTLLDFFKLPHDYVEEVSVDRADGNVNVRVKLIKHPHECPCCRTLTNTVKDYTTKKLKHQIIHKENTLIYYKARRYKCQVCSKTFYERNPFLHRKSKMTSTTVCNVLDDLKNPHETFASVAQRYFISTTTVVRLFDKYVDIARKPLPKILCIDEVYYRKGEYACVLLDFETQEIVDILPQRRKEYLHSYLSRIPRKELDNVEMICTDMWNTYIKLNQFYLRNAIVVVDKFHVVQTLGKKIRNVKVRIQRKHTANRNRLKKIKDELTPAQKVELEKADEAVYLISKFGWMLNKTKEEFDYFAKKKYNHYYKQYLNYWDINHRLMNCDPELETVASLMYYTSRFYKDARKDNAKEEIEILISELRSTKIAEMIEFSNTLVNYKPEIINSFNFITREHRVKNGTTGKLDITTEEIIVTNGIIENRNKVIKELKRNANGYKNWWRFRNRVLYSVNKDTRHRATELDYDNIEIAGLTDEKENHDFES